MAPVTHPATIEVLERRRISAMVSADLGTLDALLHPELLFGHTDGRVEDKSAYLDRFRSGIVRYSDAELHIESVTVVDRTALVRSRLKMRAEFATGSRQLAVVGLTVWVPQDGGWRMLAHQPTVIED